MRSSRAAHARQDRCTHPERITVTATGVTRSACERCGHLSFAFVDGLGGRVDRAMFARQIDGDPEAGPFELEMGGSSRTR